MKFASLKTLTDDDIQKRNSIFWLVRKLCSTVMLVRKLMCYVLILMDSCVSEREK